MWFDMSPAEFRAIRFALDLTLDEWGEALGYEGAHRRQQIHDMESGRKSITTRTARLAYLLGRHGIPSGWISYEPSRATVPDDSL